MFPIRCHACHFTICKHPIEVPCNKVEKTCIVTVPIWLNSCWWGSLPHRQTCYIKNSSTLWNYEDGSNSCSIYLVKHFSESTCTFHVHFAFHTSAVYYLTAHPAIRSVIAMTIIYCYYFLLLSTVIIVAIGVVVISTQLVDFSGYVTMPPAVYPIITAWTLSHQAS